MPQICRSSLNALLFTLFLSMLLPVCLRAASAGNGRSEQDFVTSVDEAIASGRLELIPLMITGDKDNRINIVVMNRWERESARAYNRDALREEFIEDARHVLKAFVLGDQNAIAPYPQYLNFFNVYAVWWPDVPQYITNGEKEAMTPRKYDTVRDRLFLPWKNEDTGWVTMLAMLNGDGGGGGAALTMDRRVGNAMIVGNEITSFIHEFNHTAPGIPDEYTSSGMWGHGGEISSATSEYRRNMIRWRAWIEPDTPIPTPYSKEYQDRIGLFEGGQSRLSYVYRPTAQGCLMGAGSAFDACDQMCAICRQRAVIRCYRWVNPLENVIPAQKRLTVEPAQTLRFSVDRIKTEPDTQVVQWRLNGRVIAQNVDRVDVTFGARQDYCLECELTDHSSFVKQDPPFSSFPQKTVSWRIVNSRPAQIDCPMQVTLQARHPVFRDVNDGRIQVQVEGGRPPYTYTWEDGVSLRNRDELDAGKYTLTVVDSDFQVAQATVELQREHDIDAQLISTPSQGGWDVTLQCPRLADVSCQWCTGTTGPSLRGVSDGDYACTISHANGSQIIRELSLKTPAEPLGMVVDKLFPACGGANNGSVILKPSGGRQPYRFIWSDGQHSDSPKRYFMAPGRYQVTMKDANLSQVSKTLVVKSEPAFFLRDVRITSPDSRSVKIENPDPDYEYRWYDHDQPAYLARYPQGFYQGTYTGVCGMEFDAEAYVVQNKAGLSVDPERKSRNNYGYWINLMLYHQGRDALATVYEIRTAGRDKFAGELKIASHQEKDVTFNGRVAEGRMSLRAEGEYTGQIELLFANHPDEPELPLCVGCPLVPAHSGNYYVEARHKKTNAISTNRLGFAITVGPERPQVRALTPDKVKDAKLLLWFDASDMNSDGVEDPDPPRRGAVMDWKDKAAGINFGSFVHYQPHQQNGKGIVSWETIWLQWMSEPVQGFQTIFMVRREHDFSAVGTAPWQRLRSYIGVGEYGKQLLSTEAAQRLGDGRVFVNGQQVDSTTAAMPEGFYLVCYEFDKPIDVKFNQTDGHWEGAMAECLVYDGTCTEVERRGIEAYLTDKWLSSVHLRALPKAP